MTMSLPTTAAPAGNWWMSDSHRYKAIGNSMAVPVMRWIGERIKRIQGEMK